MPPFGEGVCLPATVRDGDTTAPPELLLGFGGARNELASAPGGEFAGADGWMRRGLVGSNGGAGGELVGCNGVLEEGACDSGGVSGFVEKDDGEGGDWTSEEGGGLSDSLGGAGGVSESSAGGEGCLVEVGGG